LVKVVEAQYSGVCFGVRRALDILESSAVQAREEKRTAVMLGPLIHNPRVVEKYGKEGIKVVDLENIEEGSIVVVRSHGVTKEVEEKLSDIENVLVMDTTCPYVKRIHQLVSVKSEEGFAVIVMGDRDHSEVEGISSRITGEHMVISPEPDKEDFIELGGFILKNRLIYLVAQTTSRPSSYEKLIKKIREIAKGDAGIKFEFARTVCTATLRRQDAAGEMASRVDAVVVVGGRNSSNTSKLFSVVKERNPRSFIVEAPSDFDEEEIRELEKCKLVGITAGASTPDEQIDEMRSFLEKL
jgi:(E)-4-hydroxy-3-methyl-but-2-enyl pyrophosphate reductase